MGHSEKGAQSQLVEDQPALIASNTKTYVAVAILKLVEAHRINLQDPIADLLKPQTRKLLSEAGYKLHDITIKDLLSHTSSIKDYVDSSYFQFVEETPLHRWSRNEQIALSAGKGKPLAEPGTHFAYGDINYLLLTEILESRTGKPFYTAIRDLIGFEKLGLRSTWFIQLEEPPQDAKPLVHQYWETKQWDSYDLDPSWDLYGGGGMAATVKDLALFFQKLFDGEIIADKELLSQLHTFVLPQEQSNYCLGIRTISFHGQTGYYHGGFWGTDVMYLPDYDMTIAVFTLEKDKRDINAALSYAFIQAISGSK